MTESQAQQEACAQPITPHSDMPVISLRTRIAAVLMVLAVIVLATFDYLSAAGKLGAASDLAIVALNIVPLVMSAVILPVARTLGTGGTIRAQWTLFGLGLLSVGIGNVVFIVLYIATGEDPYPSVADLFTLTMYALLGAAFYLAIRSYRGIVDLRAPLAISASIATAALLLVTIMVIGPYVIFAPEETQPLITRVFNTIYPILDAYVLLMPAIALGMLVSRLGAGRVGWPWWLVIASATTLAVTDTLFAYAGYIEAGRTPLIDSGYAIAPMLLGLAALVARDVYRS